MQEKLNKVLVGKVIREVIVHDSHGRTFELVMDNGDRVEFKNPYSSDDVNCYINDELVFLK